VNLEVIGDKTSRTGPRKFALTMFFLCAAMIGQEANAQSPADRDVSGTTWECRINVDRVDASGRPTGARYEDRVLITFNPGGSSVSAKPLGDIPQTFTGERPDEWSFGEWKQEGATVRSVSNGTLESFHAQPWKSGDAEKMMELKISGDRMQGQLLSHSMTDPAIFQCQLQSPVPDVSSPMRAASSSSSQPPPGSPDVDVRFSSADSRLLTEAEMAALRDSLHWEPESVPVRYGGTAVSYLVDNQGHRLGSIQVQWTRTAAPKGTRSEPTGPAVGSFTVVMENGTSCGFLGQAELDGPKGAVIVSSVDLDSWVGLGQPGSGQTIRVEGNADLPSPNPATVLKPLAVSSALSACMTPKNSSRAESKD
jgi:hypothetical protein